MQLCTFEQSKDLKGLGFTEPVVEYYAPNGHLTRHRPHHMVDQYLPAPTQSAACDFLRERGLHCYADCSRDFTVWYACIAVKDGSADTGTARYPTHDFAISAAISKAILILKERV